MRQFVCRIVVVGLLFPILFSPGESQANQLVQIGTRSNVSDCPAFTKNMGQWPDSVLYRCNHGGITTWIMKRGILYAAMAESASFDLGLDQLRTGSSATRQSLERPVELLLLSVEFQGASDVAATDEEQPSEHTYNFLLGNDSTKWRTGVPSFAKVRLRSVYPGVDFEFTSHATGIEYDLVTSSAAALRQVRFVYHGMDSLSYRDSSTLGLHTKWGTVAESVREATQQTQSGSRSVSMRYIILADGAVQIRPNGLHEESLPLRVDPYVDFSGFFGGGASETVWAVSDYRSDTIVFCGITHSANFPATVNAYQSVLYGATDAFITKMPTSGTLQKWTTYLGGGGHDVATSVWFRPNNNVCVTGITTSNTFPTVSAYDATFNGDEDIIVTEVSAGGNSLIFSSYYGGSSIDRAYAIDHTNLSPYSTDTFFVAGLTLSPNFPLISAPDNTCIGSEAVVMKLPAGQSTPVYSSFFGGSGDDQAWGIFGRTIVGATTSVDLPCVGGLDCSYGGGSDGFMAQFSADLQSVNYCTYVGGSGDDGLIATDGYIAAGYTSSGDFPTVNAYQSALRGPGDGVVIKIGTGPSIAFSTYLGGSADDYITALDGYSAAATVTGRTWSTDFPCKWAYDSTFNGTSDAFVTRLTNSGTQLVFSTYLGGAGFDEGYAVEAGSGGIFVLGMTENEGFPNFGFLGGRAHAGAEDVFVTKFGCCVGTTGNCNYGDIDDVVDIDDVIAMADYLTVSGDLSSCRLENDVDSDGTIDISDLAALVDFLFGNPSIPLPVCP